MQQCRHICNSDVFAMSTEVNMHMGNEVGTMCGQYVQLPHRKDVNRLPTMTNYVYVRISETSELWWVLSV